MTQALEVVKETGIRPPPIEGTQYGTGGASAGLPAALCLSLTVEVTQQFVGQVPGGFRIDLYYSGEKSPVVVPAESGLGQPLQRRLRHARILSGNDWATINSETVLDFDGRITLALTPDEKLRSPVAGRLRGRANLRDCLKSNGERLFYPDATPAQIFALWQLGFEEESYLPLVLAASFDVPTLGLDDEQTRVYAESHELAKSLFIGRGKAIFRKAPYGAVKTIELGLFTIKPDSVYSESRGPDAS